MVDRRVGRFPDLIKFLDANQCVLIGGVLMIEFVLNETGQTSKFRNVLPKQAHLVHCPKYWGDIAPLIQDFQESLVDMLILEKITVDQRKVISDRLRQVRMQF